MNAWLHEAHSMLGRLFQKNLWRDWWRRPRPELYVLVLGLFFGLIWVFLIPPMQGGDEPNHLMRAYQLSQFNLRSDPVRTTLGGVLPADLQHPLRLNPYSSSAPNNIGGVLPAGLINFTRAGVGVLPGYPQYKFTWSMWQNLTKFKIGKAAEPIAFPNTSVYSPVAYIPDVPAIWIGRLFGDHPLVMMYLARIFSLVLGVGLIALAICLLPFGKLPLAVIALLPMTLGQLSTVTADTMVLSLSFLTLAVILRYSFMKRPMSLQQAVFLVSLIGLASLTKPVLFPIALLALGLLYNSHIDRKFAWRTIAACFLVGIVLTAAWNGAIQKRTAFGYANAFPGSNYSKQLKYVTHQPVKYVGVLYQTFVTSKFDPVPTSFIGDLGWLDVPLPLSTVLAGFVVITIAILATIWGEELKPPGRLRLAAATIALAIVLLTTTAQYLYAMTVHQPWDDGVQGRYFIPAAIFAVIALLGGQSALPRRVFTNISRNCLAASAALLTIMTVTIWLRYYVS